ncbi:MAG: 3-deoxy-D-manno-octulosonic acid transferase [Cyclobacteriaceae bacterium]|jgi:3-deoxy-D-manno-octulosonic-acid transferase|nr:3-deoxy-D-manno-octulosonic acid transferase [Cyclobacteriaceae bacterium]
MYWFFMFLYQGLLTLAASFHTKARLFVNGRKKLLARVQEAFRDETGRVVWFHAASLGEFEQGRPVMEQLKREFPSLKILLTFYSPSGYELRKTYAGADYVFYLPWDYPSHMRTFVQITKPMLAIFIKYEFWKNAIAQAHAHHIPVISISSIFREGQVYFTWYGGSQRAVLRGITHFFVQNERSRTLLQAIGIQNVSLSGDTRFDRVSTLAQQATPIEQAERFKADDKVFVIGSCWREDLDILFPFINEEKNLKFIIAPHEIDEAMLAHIETGIQRKTVRLSQNTIPPDTSVLLIDSIGLLSRLYRYGEFAFVGGAFGKGLHNILEAACYGMPIFFGNKNYRKFQEAHDLLMRGGAFDVGSDTELKEKYENVNVPENFLRACEVTKTYVSENTGATEKIMTYLRTRL